MLGELRPNQFGTTAGLWHLNGNSTDFSGNNNHGTSNNITYSQANGKFVQGAGFNGSSSSITTATQVLPTTATAFTISMWIKSAAYANGGTITSDRTGGSYIYNYNWTLNSTAKLENVVHDGASIVNPVTGATTVSANVWHFVALVWNGTTQSLYLDGKLDGSAANTYFSNHAAYPSFGVRQGPATDGYYSGQMDEIHMTPTALTANQIRTMYALGKGLYY